MFSPKFLLMSVNPKVSQGEAVFFVLTLPKKPKRN